MIVEVKQGKLEGTESRSVLSDKVYYSFLGIPYAKPPIDDLRFRPPVPHEGWEDVRSAQTEGSYAYQKNFATILFPNSNLPKYTGSEDCLYLNVYVPEPPSEITTPKAVMVFIHGGAFQMGSGGTNMCSPDFLIENDVIIVTFNYRLGILGFLNMGVPEGSGNLGLKDQSLALKWVKENISSFGGNPDNITVFGQSAGAISVVLHMASPHSKDLFNKALSLSSIILVPKTDTTDPTELGFEVGRVLGYNGTDPHELVRFLKTKSPEDLLEATVVVQKEKESATPGRAASVLFLPSVETIKENAFLTDTTANLLKTAEPKPFLSGMNNKEGTLAYWMLNKEIQKIVEDDFTSVIKNNFKCDPSAVAELAAEVKKFYLGDQDLGPDSLDSILDLYTDIYFYNWYKQYDFILKSDKPLYLYLFSFDGKFNRTKQMGPRIKGAGHGDEISYIFYPKALMGGKAIEEPERTVILNMCSLLTNFAKTGNPTPPQQTVTGVEWKPCTFDQPCYLHIDESLQMKSGYIFEERRAFLRKLFGDL